LHAFSVFPQGAQPEAPLIQASDGNFYGTTAGGGTNGGLGTIFRLDTNVVVTTLHIFTGGSDGAAPDAGLVQGTDGYLYGTASSGGFDGVSGGYGTIFRVSTNGNFAILYSFGKVFTTNGPLDGGGPNAGLVQGKDGSFYGTTLYGGANHLGTIFQFTTDGVLTTLHSFTGGNEGSAPMAGLVQGADGALYGTTADWVQKSGTGGTIFRITTNGAFTSLYSFTNGIDGALPMAGLIQGLDGALYGTADFGGSGDGTIFKITTNGTFASIYQFTNGTDGSVPSGGVIQGADGTLYGTTAGGGNTNGGGTVFRVTTNGVLTTIYEFAGGNDGAGPFAGLIISDAGKLYGTTTYGSTNDAGTVFNISTSGIYSSLFSFPGINDGFGPGFNPSANLILGQDVNFYCTVAYGVEFGNCVV